jgi:hypothetical protein
MRRIGTTVLRAARTAVVQAAPLVAIVSGVPGDARAEPAAAIAPRYLLFSGLDLWRNGGFGHMGLLWSPNGLDRAGFVLKLMTGAGDYRYLSGTTRILGKNVVASILPGWRFKGPELELSLFAGLDLQRHRFFPDDPGNDLRGGAAGIRAGAELWSEPLPGFKLSAAASVSTIGRSYWARAALGWRVNEVWIGPELHALGDGRYRQVRLGAHVVGLRLADVEWSAGIGWVKDSERRSGAYARLGVLTRR